MLHNYVLVDAHILTVCKLIRILFTYILVDVHLSMAHILNYGTPRCSVTHKCSVVAWVTKPTHV